MGITIKDLGLTREELRDRVVKQISDRFLAVDGEDCELDSPLVGQIHTLIRKRLDQRIEEIFDKHIAPKVITNVENLVMQETNRWGEKTKKQITFREYLVARTETYLTEEVNFEGKSKSQADSYSWKGTQTRIAHMIHQHLHYNIEKAMKDAVMQVMKNVKGGLQETVRMKLEEIAESLRVEVKTRS